MTQRNYVPGRHYVTHRTPTGVVIEWATVNGDGDLIPAVWASDHRTISAALMEWSGHVASGALSPLAALPPDWFTTSR